MGRPLGADDRDWEMLDAVISLALDIQERMSRIKEATEEPEVLRLALWTESDALIIQKRARDYRPRLEWLKEMARLGAAGHKVR